MSKELIISPVSIDLGAKNTGVYFAHYPAGSSIEDIEKDGKVYQLEKDNYTLLMVNRTAKRHQRRGYDRRQMVKRLFRLIWEKHLKLEWDKNVQQTTSFLFNRRGFSFLTEEYDAEILSRFPEEVYQLFKDTLPNGVSKDSGGDYDFAKSLMEWAREGENKVKTIFDVINKEPKRVAKRLVFIDATDKLKNYCETRKGNKEIEQASDKGKVKFSKLSKWIWDGWQQARVEGLNNAEIKWKNPDSYDLITYLNQQTPETARKISDSLPDTSKEEKELKASCWNFKAENFKLEDKDKDFIRPEPLDENATRQERGDYEKAVIKWIRLHLQHLAFAIHKTLNELQSGGRHRSKYFEEVEAVLKNKAHTHGYLKEFCGKLQSGNFKPQNPATSLTCDSLANLICHLSNFELKPLRKYFNDERHKAGDYWDEGRLNRIFSRWITSEWRINPEKDKDKVESGKGDYRKLCKDWNDHKGSVVDFWLKTAPYYTIPPYQDNNNRRPPRCQSLVFNPTFLDNNYKSWQAWLSELKELESAQEYLASYEEELENLQGGKDRSYFSDKAEGNRKTQSGYRNRKHLDARLLQFIFDRAKADDPMNLNEIYSHTKKYRQVQSTEQEKEGAKKRLEESIRSSELPCVLKTHRDYQNDAVFEQGSFLHLTCKYYKIRQKARDGRVFIHPEYRHVNGRGYENTGRFNDKGHLLTYCNHKPRQKRYQMLDDLAGLLQVAPKKLAQFVDKRFGATTDEKLFNWLCGIDALRSNCDKAAKEQKERRGSMKLDIQKIHGLIYHRIQGESPSMTEIRGILRDSKVQDAEILYRLCERAKKLCLAITDPLYETSKQQQWRQDLDNNPASAVYLLAQINNLAFKERSGNANTCAVCSADNARRMQTVTSENIKESHAKAQRLPAIETRLIDGAVMRMARIVGGAIAKDKWEKIKDALEAGKHVRVPIITESNRFEFEPSLNEIKGRKLSDRENQDRSKGQEALAESKKERIREASLGICPYTGKPLGEASDKDHIIPRSSEWGTLNDEANLIWVSAKGNRKVKGDSEFSLSDLKPAYKEKQFGTSVDQEIETWIIKQVGDGKGENFTFGRYRSFINLAPDQQKAFRHALFLVGHPLREKVINAINNRTRTLVNGTQRYFAHVLADNLHKKAKFAKKQHLLSFDFFGVEAQDNTRGDGIHDLRSAYEKTDQEVFEFAKHEGRKQQAYSHLLDAQLAFAMAADAHKNDGGFKLEIDNSCNLWPLDISTGEILDNTILDAIRVRPEDMQEMKLERNKPDQTTFAHRSIHRDGIYAERYLPILVHKNKDEVRIGFDWNNSYKLRDTKPNRNKLYFALRFNRQGIDLHLTKDNSIYELKKHLSTIASFNSKTKYFHISLNVDAIHSYYVQTYNTSKGWQQYSNEMKFLRSLSYRTEKKKITTFEEAKKVLEDQKKFQAGNPKLTLPVKKVWERLVSEWKNSTLESDAFLRQFFREPERKLSHEKVRKVFSLPIKTDEGRILLVRNSWNGKGIFQIVNDSDSRKVNTKIFIPVFVKSRGEIGKLLSESAKSERMFLLNEDNNQQYYSRIDDDIKVINPKVWYAVAFDDGLSAWGIKKLEFCIDNLTRPQVRLTLNNKPKPDDIEKVVGHQLLKPRDKGTLMVRLQEVTEYNTVIEYTGTGFQKGIYEKLLPVLKEYYR